MRLTKVILLLITFAALWLAGAPTASAHVVPTSSIQLDVGYGVIRAAVGIPVSDLQSATGIDLGDRSAAAVNQHASAIRQYLLAHFTPTSDDGQAWTVSLGPLSVKTTGNAATTGLYPELDTVFTLTPPAGSDENSFNLGYNAIVDHVATHVVIVTARSSGTTYAVGSISRDTVTNTVQPLHVDLGSGREYRGFVGLLGLGVEHIREGTDHQLFLLTLLLPAPLLARAGRWSGVVGARRAIRRIATITLSFTVGHSVTLALGALGVPVPQHLVEALIAVSILVAAAHAVRPLFPGREALVAASFGLIHGLAFAEALRALHLSGVQLVLALLGFNLGIEAMQLLIVALVLPPLILLARSGRYRILRVMAAGATGIAAAGWLGARVGWANPVADAADRIGVVAVPAVAALWLAAIVITFTARRRRGPADPAQDGYIASGALVGSPNP